MELSRSHIIALAFLFEGAALLIAALLANYLDISLLPLSYHPVRDVVIGFAGTIPPFAFFLFSVSKRADRIPVLGPLKKIVLTEVGAIFRNSGLNDLVVISLLAGVGEELLFRGVIQVRFGIVFASVLFGVLHFVSPAYAIVTAIMGLYLGIIFHISGGLLAPVIIHFLYDLAALVYLKYYVKTEEGEGG
ncbi:MAG: CPBP family intramembrane metalloprotease [Nitrospiraceae bacterium]|nr:MAG: CPBP family intramembrane metalloprotease [Nitrospiraceae bacterium]